MPLFLAVFFLIYSGIHTYAFFKAKAALDFSPAVSFCVAFFMAFMVLAPFLTRLSEKAGLDLLARLVAYAGYIWLGLLFLFFSSSIALELYRLLLSLIGFISGRVTSHLGISAALSFYLPLSLAVVIALYGYLEAGNIRTESLVIKSKKIGAPAGRLRIVQISDIHLGLIVRENRLRKILQKVREAKPDVLVSTGDLVDGEVCDLNSLYELFKEIKPRYGKFAITGNHEFFAGYKNAECFTEEAGFTLLRAQAATVAGINIAGVDDPSAAAYGLATGPPEDELLRSLPREKFTILLKHRPFINKASLGLFDLQLSGHVHKGQIFPFSLITWLYYPIQSGFASLPGSSIYVSRGSGTWGPPIRFLSPPEVTVIELISA